MKWKLNGNSFVQGWVDARRCFRRCAEGSPADLARRAIRKLTMIEFANQLSDLRSPPANHLEALKGNRAGQHSIRINDQWRICFVWTDAGVEDVEIVDYH